ncbi:MAG: hypothetical protein PHG06_00400 [Parabacteroides sp.]|nr:hypothetical protein [Parabacteroides sp.]
MTEKLTYIELLNQIFEEQVGGLPYGFLESLELTTTTEISAKLPDFFIPLLREGYATYKDDDKDITFEEYIGLMLCKYMLH